MPNDDTQHSYQEWSISLLILIYYFFLLIFKSYISFHFLVRNLLQIEPLYMTKTLQSLAQEGQIIFFFFHSKTYSKKSAFILVSKYNLRRFLSMWTFRYFMRDEVLNNIFRNGTTIVHCTTLQTRSDLCIPRYETARPRSQFIHPCISRSQMHECSNWERGRADSLLYYFWNICFEFSVQCRLLSSTSSSPPSRHEGS